MKKILNEEDTDLKRSGRSSGYGRVGLYDC